MAIADTVPLDPNHLRQDFPILETMIHGTKQLVYLDNAASTQRPTSVIDSISEAYRISYANVHRGSHWLSDASTGLYEDSRSTLRQFINAKTDNEIVFTAGTTSGINLVARSYGDEYVSANDEILLSEMEHHSNLVPWQQLAQRTGCRVRYIPLTDDGRLCLDDLDSLLTDRTKIVALASVSNVLGTVNSLQSVVKRAHDMGAIVMIDAAQAAPHMPVDVQALDVDFAAFSGHKMLGPSGVGFLYGREKLLEAMPPFLGGGSMIKTVTLDGFEPAELPAKFEAGTPPIVPAAGMTAAIRYLESVGLERIDIHERKLVARAHQVLQAIDGVRILGPVDVGVKAGIVSFVVEGIHPHDIAQYLDTQGIAIRAGHHCAMPLHARLGVSHSCRASFYLYNTLAEVDALGEALIKAKQLFLR